MHICSQVDIDSGPFPPQVAAVLKSQFNLQSQHVAYPYADYESQYRTGIEDTVSAAQIGPQIAQFAAQQQRFTIPVDSLKIWRGIHPGIYVRLVRTERLSAFENDLRAFLNDLAIKPYAGRRAGVPLLNLHLATRNLEPSEVPVLEELFAGMALSPEVPITNIGAVSDAMNLGIPGRFMTTLLFRYDFPV